MVAYIYSIFNKVTNLRYIGLSKSINRRFNEHKRELNKNIHSNQYLQNAWNKYGKDSFIFQLVEICNESTVGEREKYYISLFMSNDSRFGYNLTSGGLFPQMSAQTRKKMSDSHKGKKCFRTPEHTEKIAAAQRGKKISETNLAKLQNRMRTNHPLKGKLHPARKQIYCITNGETYESTLDASYKLNLDPSAINKVCNLKRKQESGFRFIRIEDFIGWL